MVDAFYGGRERGSSFQVCRGLSHCKVKLPHFWPLLPLKFSPTPGSSLFTPFSFILFWRCLQSTSQTLNGLSSLRCYHENNLLHVQQIGKEKMLLFIPLKFNSVTWGWGENKFLNELQLDSLLPDSLSLHCFWPKFSVSFQVISMSQIWPHGVVGVGRTPVYFPGCL